MSTLDVPYPLDARFRALEDRLTSVERDIAIIKTTLEHLDKRLPSPWLIMSLILPLYGLFVLGYAGVFYFLLNYARP